MTGPLPVLPLVLLSVPSPGRELAPMLGPMLGRAWAQRSSEPRPAEVSGDAEAPKSSPRPA